MEVKAVIGSALSLIYSVHNKSWKFVSQENNAAGDWGFFSIIYEKYGFYRRDASDTGYNAFSQFSDFAFN